MKTTEKIIQAALNEPGTSTVTFEVYDLADDESLFAAYSPESFLEQLEAYALERFDDCVDADTEKLEDVLYSVLQDVYVKLTPCDDRTLARVFAKELGGNGSKLQDRLDDFLDDKAKEEYTSQCEDEFYSDTDEEAAEMERTGLAHMRGEILLLQMASERLEKEIADLKKAVKPQAKRKSK